MWGIGKFLDEPSVHKMALQLTTIRLRQLLFSIVLWQQLLILTFRTIMSLLKCLLAVVVIVMKVTLFFSLQQGIILLILALMGVILQRMETSIFMIIFVLALLS